MFEEHFQALDDETMKLFLYDHLPAHLQPISKQFHDLAQWMYKTLPVGEQRHDALKKLVESKDCAVRTTARK